MTRAGMSILVLGLALAGCDRNLSGKSEIAPSLKATTESPVETQVSRGQYLVNSVGCHDCHTPKIMGPNGPEPDPARLLSGHSAEETMTAPPAIPPGSWMVVGNTSLTAWSGPWGVSYAANLTPDADTGLGNWTEAMFVGALRTGKHMGASRPILPPMPWQAYRHLSDDDLKAMFAYLRSIPPVKNRVPDPVFASQP